MIELDRLVIFGVLAKVARELREELTNAVVERMKRYYDDPVGFARKIVGIEPWRRQRELLKLVAREDRVLCRAGHKVSKTTSAIILALWFVATRPRARVLMTAPTAAQIKRVLWREMGLHYPRVASILEGPSDLPKDPATGLAFSGNREIFGRASRTKEGAAGVSGGEMLFIVDEASGFSDEQYEALVGNAASRVKILGLSNPTRAAGWFFEGFRNGLWKTLHISSEESPNVIAALERRRARIVRPELPSEDAMDDVIKGVARLAWIERMRAECGANYRTHPIYQVRVLGEFPSSGPNAIVSLTGVEEARRRWDAFVRRNQQAGQPIDHGIWGPLELGVDPARFGDDDAAICPRRGRFVYPLRILSGRVEGVQIAEATVQCARELRRPRMDAGPVKVKLDPLGRAGADTLAALRHHEATRSGEILVLPIDVNEASDDPTKYSDLRTQLWFAGADWIGVPEEDDDEDLDELVEDHADEIDFDGPMLPPDPRFTQELLAATYKFDAQGRQLVISKDAMREQLGRSPDRADAFNLCVYTPPGGRVNVLTGKELERDPRRRPEPKRSIY